MRFVAAGLVFLFHSLWQNFFVSPDAQKTTFSLFFQGGWAGVSFFFVLSGFVLTWAARPTDTPAKFWRRRFFKIYPNHLLTFIAAAILLSTVAGATLDRKAGILNVLLLQSWHTDLNIRTNFNPVAWSLSCEALFYLSFPFLYWAIKKIRPERLWFWTVVSAASVISIPSFAKLLPAAQPFPVTGFTTWEMWFASAFPPVRMLEFIFGIFMARIVLTGQKLPLKLGGAVALAVGSYFVAPLFGPNYRFAAVMLVPLGLLIAAGAVADVNKEKGVLSSKLMVWLGDISFAFYMWHYMVLTYGHRWLGQGESWSTPRAIFAMALLFAVTLALSAATFNFIERPIMQRFGTSRRKRNLAVVAQGPTGASTDRAA
jgi:mycarose O-acyltransferase